MSEIIEIIITSSDKATEDMIEFAERLSIIVLTQITDEILRGQAFGL